MTSKNDHDASSEDGDSFITSRAGGEIFVQRRGHGAPLVWVGGLGDDHTGWAAQVEQFANDYTCVTFDNRGVGRSTVLPGPYSMEDFADDAHDIVTELALGPVTAIGSSMGGAICQRWALRYPEDISRLVLASTWGEQDPYLDLLLSHWISLIDAGQEKRLAESLFLGCYSGSHLSQHKELIDEFLATPLPDLDGLKAAAQACRGHHALGELSSVDIPALVIAGSLDIVARPELSAHLAQHLPLATLKTIQSGHMIMWERPEEFAEAITGFLLQEK